MRLWLQFICRHTVSVKLKTDQGVELSLPRSTEDIFLTRSHTNVAVAAKEFGDHVCPRVSEYLNYFQHNMHDVIVFAFNLNEFGVVKIWAFKWRKRGFQNPLLHGISLLVLMDKFRVFFRETKMYPLHYLGPYQSSQTAWNSALTPTAEPPLLAIGRYQHISSGPQDYYFHPWYAYFQKHAVPHEVFSTVKRYLE